MIDVLFDMMFDVLFENTPPHIYLLLSSNSSRHKTSISVDIHPITGFISQDDLQSDPAGDVPPPDRRWCLNSDEHTNRVCLLLSSSHRIRKSCKALCQQFNGTPTRMRTTNMAIVSYRRQWYAPKLAFSKGQHVTFFHQTNNVLWSIVIRPGQSPTTIGHQVWSGGVKIAGYLKPAIMADGTANFWNI